MQLRTQSIPSQRNTRRTMFDTVQDRVFWEQTFLKLMEDYSKYGEDEIADCAQKADRVLQLCQSRVAYLQDHKNPLETV